MSGARTPNSSSVHMQLWGVRRERGETVYEAEPSGASYHTSEQRWVAGKMNPKELPQKAEELWLCHITPSTIFERGCGGIHFLTFSGNAGAELSRDLFKCSNFQKSKWKEKRTCKNGTYLDKWRKSDFQYKETVTKTNSLNGTSQSCSRVPHFSILPSVITVLRQKGSAGNTQSKDMQTITRYLGSG